MRRLPPRLPYEEAFPGADRAGGGRRITARIRAAAVIMPRSRFSHPSNSSFVASQSEEGGGAMAVVENGVATPPPLAHEKAAGARKADGRAAAAGAGAAVEKTLTSSTYQPSYWLNSASNESKANRTWIDFPANADRSRERLAHCGVESFDLSDRFHPKPATRSCQLSGSTDVLYSDSLRVTHWLPPALTCTLANSPNARS